MGFTVTVNSELSDPCCCFYVETFVVAAFQCHTTAYSCREHSMPSVSSPLESNHPAYKEVMRLYVSCLFVNAQKKKKKKWVISMAPLICCAQRDTSSDPGRGSITPTPTRRKWRWFWRRAVRKTPRDVKRLGGNVKEMKTLHWEFVDGVKIRKYIGKRCQNVEMLNREVEEKLEDIEHASIYI